MYGRTANAQQLLTRTANHSTKGSAKGFVDGMGENAAAVLDENERRESRRRAINAELETLRNDLALQKEASNRLLRARRIDEHHESIAKANDLRKRIAALQTESASLNLKSRRLPASLVERAFVDICKESMTKAQFDLYMRQAMARVRAIEEEGNDEQK